MKYTEFNFHEYETHMIAYNLISLGSTVLDIGCATGYFAKELSKKHCLVTGVDSDKKALTVAKKYCNRVIYADLENDKLLKLPDQKYDYILILDVIEHLRNASNLLLLLQKRLKSNGKLIISTPNIAHISVRFNLLFGKFSYQKRGILDKTHVHFYTKQSLIELLEKTHLSFLSMQTSSDFGQIPLFGRFFRNLSKGVQAHITSLFPSLLGVQWIVISKKSN